jgi:hypothetical protein
VPLNPASRLKRRQNIVSARERLAEAGITFEERQGGGMLIVAGAWQFAPGTGVWTEQRGDRRGRGVLNLIRVIQSEESREQQQ